MLAVIVSLSFVEREVQSAPVKGDPARCLSRSTRHSPVASRGLPFPDRAVEVQILRDAWPKSGGREETCVQTVR
jgi:hypothetical protein